VREKQIKIQTARKVTSSTTKIFLAQVQCDSPGDLGSPGE
jgi:hypothetical protein